MLLCPSKDTTSFSRHQTGSVIWNVFKPKGNRVSDVTFNPLYSSWNDVLNHLSTTMVHFQSTIQFMKQRFGPLVHNHGAHLIHYTVHETTFWTTCPQPWCTTNPLYGSWNNVLNHLPTTMVHNQSTIRFTKQRFEPLVHNHGAQLIHYTVHETTFWATCPQPCCTTNPLYGSWNSVLNHLSTTMVHN